MSLEEQIHQIGRQAREAARALIPVSTAQKNTILLAMADELDARAEEILAANAKDVTAAETQGLTKASIDRLRLTDARLAAMADDVRQVAKLESPVGEKIKEWTRPNGLEISKVRTPIGVIGIIYESRPNVTSDAAVLCIKTGNAVILRGGSESLSSNVAIAAALQAGGARSGLPANAIQLIPTRDREAVRIMAQMDKYVDMIVPRGGHALIEAVVTHARMPVIKHYHGVCHVYVDKAADLAMAEKIVINAKCQRPGVCNALETLVLHRDIAREFLGQAVPAFQANGLALHADAEAFADLSQLNYPALHQATEETWTTEYLDLMLSVRVVDGIAQAIDHIEQYGSHHSDSIITKDEATAEKFLSEVDSATVFWNASTRFNDGGEFGFGAEIGISTDKLHARGPMALEELTTYKYLIRGDGQTRP